jgi:hypothetical protein
MWAGGVPVLSDGSSESQPAAKFWNVPLDPGAAQSILWVAALCWSLAALFKHDPSSPFSAAFGLLFGLLAMLSIGRMQHSKTPDGLGLTRSDMLVAVGMPLVLAFGSTEPMRGHAPLGLDWGLAACAGVTLGLAAAYSFLEWRANA